MSRPSAPSRDEYFWFRSITTRWSDNDIYGHINNVVYYGYFDTVANSYLIEEGGLDIHAGPTIGLVVASSCAYHAPLEHPSDIQGGLRIDRLGTSSVQYGIGIFESGSETAAANGTFTHVFVDRDQRTSLPIPDELRRALSAIQIPA
ncbi:MAG: thioesterase family protein [Pseudomonadota bacterium]